MKDSDIEDITSSHSLAMVNGEMCILRDKKKIIEIIERAERCAKIEILEKELHAIYNTGFSLGRIKDQIAELKEMI